MAANSSSLPPLPENHLSHPEQWATGGDPATTKQKAFIKTLEKQHPEAVPSSGMDVDEMGKSEASEVIERLKSGQKVGEPEDMGVMGKTEGLNGSTGGEFQKGVREEEEKEVKEVTGATDAKNQGGKKDEGTEKTGTKRKATVTEDEPKKVKGKSDTNESATDDVDDSGKDTKPSKQTTLDGMMTTSKGQTSASADKTAPDDELTDVPADQVESDLRDSKKPRLMSPSAAAGGDTDSPTPAAEVIPSPVADAGTTGQNGNDDTLPGDGEHLDHPENWTTGDDPATAKQKGFIKVLEKQKGVSGSSVEGLGKSEASEKIEELKEM